jgi:hypothetical protein
VHTYSLSPGATITAATLTVVTWDLEDGGAGDGNGGGPYDTTLYLDGHELVGAFDTVYSPDVGPSLPNATTFMLDSSLFPLLLDGMLQVVLNPGAGLYSDAISIDYAELAISASVPSSVPDSGSTVLLFGIGLVAVVGAVRLRRRQRL